MNHDFHDTDNKIIELFGGGENRLPCFPNAVQSIYIAIRFNELTY